MKNLYVFLAAAIIITSLSCTKAISNKEIEGKWDIVSFYTVGGREYIYKDKPGITFNSSNNTFTGMGFCNQFSGNYSLQRKKFSINNLAVTKINCDNKFEATILSLLNSANSITTENGRIYLNSNDWFLERQRP